MIAMIVMTQAAELQASWISMVLICGHAALLTVWPLSIGWGNFTMCASAFLAVPGSVHSQKITPAVPPFLYCTV